MEAIGDRASQICNTIAVNFHEFFTSLLYDRNGTKMARSDSDIAID
ncbi:MAG: hypothetical protein AB4290_14010 [Spirulina sp.]